MKSFLPLFPWNCELTNDILKRRNDDVKSRRGIGNHPNVLTGKMISSCCGTSYYIVKTAETEQGKSTTKGCALENPKNGASSCYSIHLYEDEQKPLLFEVFQEAEANTGALIEEYVPMYYELHTYHICAKEETRYYRGSAHWSENNTAANEAISCVDTSFEKSVQTSVLNFVHK